MDDRNSRELAQAHVPEPVLAAAVFEPNVSQHYGMLGLWTEYQVWRRLRDGRAASRNVLLAVTATRLYALEVRRGLRRWYVWGSLGDWPRDRLHVRLVKPRALAVTWAEPVTGTVRQMRPYVDDEETREVVWLLTEPLSTG